LRLKLRHSAENFVPLLGPGGNSGSLRGGWQTAGVVFVADALGGWLVGQLADAGRKKLTEVILGSEQERALRQAADAAVWATAVEMSLSGGEQAGQVAMVISEVFRDPVPDAPLAGPVMLLEGLQAGIAGQLTVLDDAELTGTEQSSADVLGVPAAVLADRLTGHLVRKIIVRGSGGGPLTPLADQFNHELTRLQGQRIEGMLARLAGEVRDTLPRLGSGVMEAGRPLDEVTDPFVLEVHRPVQPEDAPPGLPVLPPYIPREHDRVLYQVVAAAAEDRSGIAVLVGGSSTGKTRACWEALGLLRDQDPPWRLWHPIDPSRPDAALRELTGIGPRTVVWLNEVQFYLDVADGGLGERVAGGLRELLHDPGRAPVLVLATLWPRFWDVLTARPPDSDDLHAQARELLAGHDITVPAAFTPAQVGQLTWAGDMRLVLAARSAQDGEVIQFLAGAPELLARYRNAPPAVRALISAAMDARRLGTGAGLSQAFLEAAAPGYLTNAEWDGLGEDWLEQALAYTAVPCKGARGPLTRIRPRTARLTARNRGGQPGSITAAAGPLYRLADYLDQHGRAHRASQIPPVEFWAAAAAHAAPGDQAALGKAADDRGLYRDAAQLHKNAAAAGNIDAALYLSSPPHYLRATLRPLHLAASRIPLDNHPAAVAGLLDNLRAAGAEDQVTVLADRAAVNVSLDNPLTVAGLLDKLRTLGAEEQVTALLHRDPAAHASLDNLAAVARLLDTLRRVSAEEQVTVLADRAAVNVSLDNLVAVAELLDTLRRVSAEEQATVLADRAAAHAPLDNPVAVARLLDTLRTLGAEEQVTALLHRDPAVHASLDNPYAVAGLLDSLRKVGTEEQVTALLHRDPAVHASLDNPAAVARLLDTLRRVGAEGQVTDLADRAAAHASLDNPVTAARLLDKLRAMDAEEQVTALLHRDPAVHASLDNPAAVARLLDSLRAAGAEGQVTALANRAAAHVFLDAPVAHYDPVPVGTLLDTLRRVGAEEQVTVLADRAAAHAPLDNPYAVARLLDKLRAVGAEKQLAALLHRNPAVHAPLDDLFAAATLLDSLEESGAEGQVTVLADRAAAHAPLDNPFAVAGLLDKLRAVGAEKQVTALADRLPAAGMFMIFCEQEGHQNRFRFGREPDGNPAEPWTWEDLD
jgi:hypothetical protein